MKRMLNINNDRVQSVKFEAQELFSIIRYLYLSIKYRGCTYGGVSQTCNFPYLIRVQGKGQIPTPPIFAMFQLSKWKIDGTRIHAQKLYNFFPHAPPSILYKNNLIVQFDQISVDKTRVSIQQQYNGLLTVPVIDNLLTKVQ